MRPVIYQLFVRHFSNHKQGGEPWGSRETNGCGTFAGVNDAALQALAGMGVTHVWFTGVLRHATQTAHPGLPADPAAVVKGIAGSPYAVTDYFDVDPDLAEEPENRLEEYAELLRRCRRWGMVPMMDFIPNHVSRCYRSTVRPQSSFGTGDNTGVFFARDNSFFYLHPQNSNCVLKLPEAEFEPEHGHGRVTGNNAETWSPGVYDWYETVKLNYGCNYHNGAYGLPGFMAAPGTEPRTWRLMDEILAYWQRLGVGGFRCDMAHMVPDSFWNWAICHARLRDENVFFMAEGYNDHMKVAEGDVHDVLLAAGFNAVYDSAAYDALRSLYERGAWANDLDPLQREDRPMFRGGVRYVENHDEQRLAAPCAWGGQGGSVARAVMAAQYTTTACPVLIYNGQECGEDASGPGGFGGDNGRTSIFDYTNLPHFQHWTAGGAYDGSGMTEQERTLRDFTARLLPLLQHPAFAKGGFYGLNWANRETPAYGRSGQDAVSGHYLYAYLRHYRKAKATVLAVCNFHPAEPYTTRIHIPRNAQEWCGKKPGTYTFHNLLDPAAPAITATHEKLATDGLEVTVPAGQALLLEWR
ncbi:MAG: alpha-amylase family glycosyl hydrolase [Akkermansia sp.]|nr:alpha-amylase family glycosyl hydrolase [Akkermansia sp.]